MPLISITTDDVDLMTSDTGDVSQFSASSWGIFDDDGNQVIDFDSFGSVEILKEWKVSDYPIEEGSFDSYNRVELPATAKVQLRKGGTDSDRAGFIDQIQEACASTDLYTLTLPDDYYTNMNATHYDYARTERNGVTLLSPTLWLEEIRDNAQASLATSPQEPQSEDGVNSGGVQAQPPTGQQSNAIASTTLT